MDFGNLTDLAVKGGAAYAALQGVAQGLLALQRIFVANPEKTLFFKALKFVISGPSRNPAPTP